ncbi:hypothetical protein F4808DRAFT_458490 [Astrocystis sublimbata]|nr:hypothetical protein F4808DRAFT_458490 [Astrocystis sublimbata]
MSVPPQLIRVKRKATEEAPLSYLRVQETKRHRSTVFVYQRQNEEIAFADSIPRQVQKPIIHTSPSNRQPTAFQSATRQNTHPGQDKSRDAAARTGHDDGDPSRTASPRAADSTNTTNAQTVDSGPIEPRRFHMSRKEMLLARNAHPGHGPHGGVSKKRPATAMFVERKIKGIPTSVRTKLHAANNPPAVAPTLAGAPATEVMRAETPEPRRFKKPGVAKLQVAKDDKPQDKPQLPKSMTDRWNVDMQQLTAEMEAYAMQQIGLNLQRVEEERREQERPRAKISSSLKFKPKPPVKRYAERHPEEARPAEDEEMVDADAEVEAAASDSDGDEYIIETYVRVPASKMGDHVPPQSVGLLVFDAEPDVEFFYREDDESDDEWAEDEEDENAENHYTADYPDEEVATDDEFDSNPYRFRTDNASDLEEFGRELGSDDEFDGGNPTSQFRTYIGRNGAKSNHL